MPTRVVSSVLLLSSQLLFAAQPQQISLTIPAGVPLRLYLTKRIPKRMNAPVEAKVLEPVYVFDRQVIPAGAVVMGSVTRLEPVSKGQRTKAMLNGDFTPLHLAYVEFTTLLMPDGRRLQLHTSETVGLNSIVPSRPPKNSAPSAQHTGVLGTGKRKAQEAIQAQVEKVKSIPDLVRGPDKKDIAEDYLLAKLPYHPQNVRKGTRFDAELAAPLSFGSGTVTRESLAMVGTQPQADYIGHLRLLTPLDSASSQKGQSVEAVLTQPIFSPAHQLVLPEGTHLTGTVLIARKARWFHRSGQLRFSFREMSLPEEVARLQETTTDPVPKSTDRPAQDKLHVRTQASLQAAEGTGKNPLKVDSEGGVQTKESKTRFLAAAASVLIASRSADNDAIRNANHQVVGQTQNVGGRTVGGGFGFGLLGAGIAQSSRYVGTAFGYYGMGWALYATLIARGSEVEFGKDAVMDIRFNARPTAPAAQKH